MKCGIKLSVIPLMLVLIALLMSTGVTSIQALDQLRPFTRDQSSRDSFKINLEKKALFSVNNYRGNIEMMSSNPLNEEALVSNVVPSGNFEGSLDSNGCPVGFFCHGTGYSEQDLAHDTEVHAGSYAASLKTLGTYSYSSTYVFQNLQGNSIFLNQSLQLTVWFNIKSNPHVHWGSSRTYFSIDVTNGSFWHTLYYEMSYSDKDYLTSNQTWSTYYLLNTTTFNSWHQLQRNITKDFIEGAGITTGLEGFYLNSFYAYQMSPPRAQQHSWLLIDDASILNGTSQEQLINGDFESGDGTGWYREGIETSGYISLTSSERVEGNKALNVSITANQSQSDGSLRLSRNFYQPRNSYFGSSLKHNPLIIEFYWNYQDTINGGNYQQATFQLNLRDTSNTPIDVNWFLGKGDDSPSWSNTTTRFYMNASGFGERETWHHFFVNMSQLVDALNVGDVYIWGFNFEIELGSEANSSVVLLLDNLSLMAYPLGDPSFDFNWDTSNWGPLMSWGTVGNASDVNLTAMSRTGLWAANVTVTSSQNAGLYRDIPMNQTQIGSSAFTDFWWQIMQFNASADAHAFILFRYYRENPSTYYYIYFILAATDQWLSSRVNDTQTVYFLADHFNETRNGWNALRINLNNAFQSAFGQAFNISNIHVEVSAFAGTSGVVSVLFDDFHFVKDTHAPTIHSVEVSNPQYYENATITVNVTDNLSGLSDVRIEYHDFGSNTSLKSIHASWNATRSSWIATMPRYSFNTTVIFRVNASDEAGNSVLDDNAGNNYSYVVLDSVQPILEVIAPENGSILNGSVPLAVQAADEGSGIAKVTISLNGTIVYSTDESEFIYLLNTSRFSNGAYQVTVSVQDEAGNENGVVREYSIQNQVTGTKTQPSSSENATTDLFSQLQERLSSIMASYGFFIGLITFPVLWAIHRLIRRRLRRSN